ncbi:MAG: BolA family transcriptional regulator [Azonexus sp.]|nr:BolA family transcriptional regulator [Betaproteobacteria bacterium]MBK8917472.1 BolA family transcriptional regulator [Betaproteobacteria bacterium]MBP6036021.1 BolA family transcriptional regulator [Azonexus sp.]MBP6906543.1 BolA family transcriptional regulator [Azonexus sp.]
MSAATAAWLRDRLATLTPLEIEVADDSHLHAGHAGAREGGHYRVSLVSAAFTGLGTAARHRLVHAAVGELRPNGIHALSIRARAPEEV